MLENVRVVMVETTHPGNIGAAARAMKTMGLADLRLVSPAVYPSAEATARASGAGDVLSAARVCADLDEALEGATLVIGTSARQRRIPWPCLTPRQLSAQLQREPESTRIAVLFGREDRGLTNDELRRCNLHVTVPANPDYGVLNVASAVQLIAYELRLALVGEDADLPEARARREAMPDRSWASGFSPPPWATSWAARLLASSRPCRCRKCSGMSRRPVTRRWPAFWITWNR